MRTAAGATFESIDAVYFSFSYVPGGGSSKYAWKDIWNGEAFEVLELESTPAVRATLNGDKSALILSADASAQGTITELMMKVKFASGDIRTVRLGVYVTSDYTNSTDQPYSTGRATISARFTNDAGQTVTEPTAGDEVWVVVSATDTNPTSSGIFSAYFDVDFGGANVTVIGEPQSMGDYTNGRTVVVNADGIKSLGGFGGSTPPGVPSSEIARFKIRVNNDQPLELKISASKKTGEEFLIHGTSKGLDPARIPEFNLTNRSSQIQALVTEQNRSQDINNDGVITPLDVLLVVNYINARESQPVVATAEAVTIAAASGESSSFDITGDGYVTALDVLLIINTINDRYNAPASGEAGPMDAYMVDQLVSKYWSHNFWSDPSENSSSENGPRT